MLQLNQHVVESLVSRGIPAVGISVRKYHHFSNTRHLVTYKNCRAAGRLKISILVNLEINRKKQHMSFCSREKQSYLILSVQLHSRLQLLQVQPVV